MDRDAVLTIVRRFRAALEKRGIRAPRLILFGSAATGTMHEGSDIDLVVISDSFRGKDYWDRIDILGDAVYEVFEPIQAIALTPDEWDRGDSLVVHFARNGQSV